MSGEDNEFTHGVILFEEPSELLTVLEHMGFLLETTNINKGVDEKIAVSFIRWDAPEDTIYADLLAYVRARTKNPVVKRMLDKVIAAEGGKYVPKQMEVIAPRRRGWPAGEDLHIKFDNKTGEPRSHEEFMSFITDVMAASEKHGFRPTAWSEWTGVKTTVAKELGYDFQNYLELVDRVEKTEGQ